MGLTNFIVTVVGVTAAVMLVRSDVKKSATTFRNNIRQIRHWLEEESASASKVIEKSTSKEVEPPFPKKDITKENKS